MNGDNLKTPLSKPRFDPSRSTAAKRDSLTAELERDPQLSTSKRQQRNQVFNSSISHAHLERQLLAAQTANNELETKLRERELQIERLERDRTFFCDREKEEREEKERERDAHDRARLKSESDIRQLRTQLTSLREEFADLQDVHGELSRSTTQTISSQKSQITTLNHQVHLLISELAQALQTIEDKTASLGALQERCDELLSHQPAAASDDSDMAVVRDELHRQASYLRTLESTNNKLTNELIYLRGRDQSIEVLKEERRGLESKLAAADSLREQVARLEAELEAGRNEREAWSANKGSPLASDHELTRLRLAHARLLEEHGATSASLTQRTAQVTDLESQLAEQEEDARRLEDDIRKLQSEVGKARAQAAVAEREVGYYKALLASYKSEEAYTRDSTTLDDATGSLDETKLEHIAELESVLLDYKSLIEQLQNELEDLQNQAQDKVAKAAAEETVSHEELDRLKSDNAQLQQDVEEHLASIDNLEQKLFDLQGEIAGGRHVPPNTRVLCLKENPDQKWLDLREEAVQRLKNENEALLKRLREVEGRLNEAGAPAASTSGSSQGGELVPWESWEQINKEKEDLQNELKQKEKRLLRLQQVFASKSAEFREAIASILGLKLAFYPNGQVRVTSMYDLNASFIFQPNSNSKDLNSSQAGMKMQLVAQGEGGPQDLPNLMQYWIENEQCTPGFLASVTLECYENWKRENEATSV
ncbi:hypothetical protein FA15DRAFT_648696 [Coprinopsis marcescibilis]|uniref:Spindle assembly checkpoint component MAD1 n=1 Tax=Coprinopsis marcescibilis TaxID=230819 RepID=A0A5C3KHK1_COPMA|nr:hypothetical protein FA15DRAFT_648696 [Coprinopsis marcescibilis]